ncbi:MAG: sulfatase family protein [Armatimonadota bacterium]
MPSASYGSRPNIIEFICHDLGQYVGCLGAPIDTPNIDELADDGVLFSTYACTAAQCSPSRGSIMTGRYPHNNGLVGLAHIGWEIGANEVTMPMYLNRAGYHTRLIGHQHEHNEAPRLGYQTIQDVSYDARTVASAVGGFLHGEAQDGQPFFVSAGVTEPHRPYEREDYDRDDPASVQPLPYLPDRPGIREDLAGLHGLIWRLDEAIGSVREALADSGLEQDTVLIFTTDHGIAMPRAKGTCYDPGIMTTLVMRWPGHFDGGRIHHELLTNCDLLPTLLDLAGADVPDQVEGRSFLGLLDQETYEPRGHAFCEMTWHDQYNPMRAVRTPRYKYIRNFGRRPLVYMPADVYRGPAGEEMIDDFYNEVRPTEELYDLARDPLEQENVIDDPAYDDIAWTLRTRVHTWMVETNDPLLYGDYPPTRLQRERAEERPMDNGVPHV